MCEILGITSKKPYPSNELLDSFFNHATACPDGWGLAVFRGEGVTMEKEPVSALDSAYLKNRLTRDVVANNLFAHIRKATLGRVEYANCHPFIWDDHSGRTWTMVHNGTVFRGSCLSPFLELQEGSTDSERLLLYLLSFVNEFEETNGRPPTEEERFRIVDDLVVRLSDGNKLNLMIFDGEIMYVHSNCPDSLYIREDGEKYVLATSPVRLDGWKKMRLNQLFSFRDGVKMREGTIHSNTFRDE